MSKQPVKKSYYVDQFKYHAAKVSQNVPTFLISGAALAGATAYGVYDHVYDTSEMPETEYTTTSSATGDMRYEMLSEGLGDIIENQTDIRRSEVGILRAAANGENVSAREQALQGQLQDHYNQLEMYYGRLMQDEDISEAQFAFLQDRLVENDLSLTAALEEGEDNGYRINLSGLNPADFQECQRRYGVNDGHGAMQNANGVEECMIGAAKGDGSDNKLDRTATSAGNMSYSMLSSNVDRMVRTQDEIRQLRLQVAEAELAGQDSTNTAARLEYKSSALQEQLQDFYGRFMQDEDISEVQFGQLQNRLVENNLAIGPQTTSVTYSEYGIDLNGLNPAHFNECQDEYRVNDGYPALQNANGVEGCMIDMTERTEEDYKSDKAGTAAFLTFPTSFSGLFLLWLLAARGLENTYYSGRPRRENYKKETLNRN